MEGFLIGLGAGLLLAHLFRRREVEVVAPQSIDLPIDCMLTFAMYDAEGNQLTERAPFSVGMDGSNKRTIQATIIRSGTVHHGVAYVGEIGSILDFQGAAQVQAGDVYMIPPGNWSTEYKPL